MSLFRSLFTPRRAACYALLDEHGVCRAFKQCHEAPTADGWVQITEIRLHWLNRALPASARLTTVAPTSRWLQAFAG